MMPIQQTTSPSSMQPHVYVVDDDDAFRRSLIFLLESVGWGVRDFSSAEAFLDALPPGSGVPYDMGCLVLDIRMPMMSGLALQQALLSRGWAVGIVFITGHGDVELAVQAMKAGACDFLEKPFKDQSLLDAVAQAVRHTQAHRRDTLLRGDAQSLLDRLSARECEVARLLAMGHQNKHVGRELGISDKTVHVHRQRIMEKTEVSSAAELARLFLRADPAALEGVTAAAVKG